MRQDPQKDKNPFSVSKDNSGSSKPATKLLYSWGLEISQIFRVFIGPLTSIPL